MHINTLVARVRKLIYIFKTLRNIANQTIVRMVYHALCLSIITYCISCWGGVAKTTLKPLEIAHRAILKVSTCRSILFSTSLLYRECNVLNVRQLYVLNTILLQHKNTPYRIINKRRKDKACVVPKPRKTFTKRFFYYLGPYLYNKLNLSCSIHGLSYFSLKKKGQILSI